jgi:hypothetical protein
MAEILLPIGGRTYDPSMDGVRLRDQALRVFELLRGAPPDHWLSLREIAGITGDPEASISARLRDLRKKEFGGYNVERRRRAGATGTWEYRLGEGDPEPEPPRRMLRSGFLKGLMFAARILIAADDLADAKRKLGAELRTMKGKVK